MSEQFPSGNLPSSLESGIDKLIHWCHGAPGAVHLMVKAYQVWCTVEGRKLLLATSLGGRDLKYLRGKGSGYNLIFSGAGDNTSENYLSKNKLPTDSMGRLEIK